MAHTPCISILDLGHGLVADGLDTAKLADDGALIGEMIAFAVRRGLRLSRLPLDLDSLRVAVMIQALGGFRAAA